MTEYHKITTLWERDAANKHRTLLEGKWATPEFEFLKDNTWIWTEKIDGTNIRIIWDGETVTYGGRTDAAQIYAPLIKVLQETCYAGALSQIFTGPAVLYGEGCGAKIQKVGEQYKSDGVMLVLFDVQMGLKSGGLWLERHNVEVVARKLHLWAAPIVGYGTLDEAIKYTKSQPNSTYGNFPSEGLVVRPQTELLDRQGRRIIGKIKYRDFIQ